MIIIAQQVKCPSCETMNDKENTLKIGTRYYCIECGERKKEETEKNKDGWDELFEYICKLYKIRPLTGMMFEQIRKYRGEPYNYTNIGMHLTLKYYYETLGNEVLDDTGLGIIPYYYDRAKKNYIQKINIESYMEEFESKEETKIVMVKPSLTKENFKGVKQLSFDNIVEEGAEDGE